MVSTLSSIVIEMSSADTPGTSRVQRISSSVSLTSTGGTQSMSRDAELPDQTSSKSRSTSRRRLGNTLDGPKTSNRLLRMGNI